MWHCRDRMKYVCTDNGSHWGGTAIKFGKGDLVKFFNLNV